MIRAFNSLLAIAGCLAMVAATADEIPERTQRCADIDEDALRLECFDQLARDYGDERASERGVQGASSRPAEPAASIPEEPAAPPPAELPDPEDRFGLTATERDSDEEAPDQVSAHISEIELRRDGHRIFTLDNGQVWIEESARQGLRLTVGDAVTIKSGLFGSYRLFASGNKSTKVDRVR